MSNDAERLITRAAVVSAPPAAAGVDVLGGGGLRADAVLGTRPVHRPHADATPSSPISSKRETLLDRRMRSSVAGKDSYPRVICAEPSRCLSLSVSLSVSVYPFLSDA